MDQNKNNNEQERLRLLYEVGREIELSNAQVLYSSVEQLKQMKESLLANLSSSKPKAPTGLKESNAKFAANTDLHEELRQLCIDVCHLDKAQFPKGYVLLGVAKNVKNDFDGYVFKKGNDVIIVYKGSKTSKDYYEDTKMAFLNRNSQFKDGQKLYDRIKNSSEFKGCNIILTGHSLGGSIAQYTGALNNVDTVTFNPYAVGDIIQKKANQDNKPVKIYTDRIINYRHPDDMLSRKNSENNIGTTYLVKGKGFPHLLEHKDKLKTRQLDYRTRQNEAFYLHAQKNEYVVHPKNQNRISKCVGSYPVSAYTKKDGTHVSSYIRTCGAKHLGK